MGTARDVAGTERNGRHGGEDHVQADIGGSPMVGPPCTVATESGPRVAWQHADDLPAMPLLQQSCRSGAVKPSPADSGTPFIGQ